MAVVGADPDQLRTTANQFVQAAERLQGSLKGLNTFTSNAAIWRGPDSERFRAQWNGQSVVALNAAVGALRAGAEVLRRNADEQDDASRADGGGGGAGTATSTEVCYEPAASSLHDMWNEIRDTPNGGDMSGYRVQKVVDADGTDRYIVFIGGTNPFELRDGQSGLAYIPAISGQPDAAQLKALERLIPEGAEVMLVGYSQGGIDAQNIAASGKLNVQQIVTFGSPVRNDLDIPGVHLRYSQDIVGYSGGVNPGLYSSTAAEGNDNVEVFAAKPSLFTVFGLGEHVGGYGGLAEKWDNEARTVEDSRAAKSAAGLTKFSGNVTDQVDIPVNGDANW